MTKLDYESPVPHARLVGEIDTRQVLLWIAACIGGGVFGSVAGGLLFLRGGGDIPSAIGMVCFGIFAGVVAMPAAGPLLFFMEEGPRQGRVVLSATVAFMLTVIIVGLFSRALD